jgi:hypothetical protein
LAIFVGYDYEAEAQARSAFYVADDRFGFDAAFLDEEVEFGLHAFFDFEVRGLDEEAVDADVEDAGYIVTAVALPADPDVLGGWKAREGTARIRRFLYHKRLPGAMARRREERAGRGRLG